MMAGQGKGTGLDCCPGSRSKSSETKLLAPVYPTPAPTPTNHTPLTSPLTSPLPPAPEEMLTVGRRPQRDLQGGTWTEG